jgi:hypothetical protein
VGTGVAVVDTVDAVLGHQQDVDVELDGPQRRGRVRREVGVARAAREDDDPVLLHVPDGPAPDEGLGHLVHVDGRS